ncbi:MAG: LPS export ABC transporter periplasmic protein LptC [Bacteroidetes bacterium HGW-Bacteroidetes-16]|nr:MAG: LPS export ABC transporter periplasmic protein LptC [Bacteroidetes bacterium HGW-Bacteroidetes-16]
MIPLKKITQLTLVIFMTGVFFSCENSLETIKEITSQDTLPVVKAYHINYTRSDSAKIQVQLISPLMEKFDGNDAYTEFAEGFEVILFDSIGQKTSTISANYGIMYERTKNMSARNDVVVKNYLTNEQLFTENLYWDRKKKTIRSGTFVKIVTPDKVIYGDSMSANESFSNREIYHIRGELELEDDEPQKP